MRGLPSMSRERDFVANRGFPPLPHTGELARAALLLEGGGKDPAGSAAANMGPWVEDDGGEGPKQALRALPSFNVAECSAVFRRDRNGCKCALSLGYFIIMP